MLHGVKRRQAVESRWCNPEEECGSDSQNNLQSPHRQGILTLSMVQFPFMIAFDKMETMEIFEHSLKKIMIGFINVYLLKMAENGRKGTHFLTTIQISRFHIADNHIL